MPTVRISLTSLLSLCLFAACSQPPETGVQSAEEDAAALVARAGAPLFDGMGEYHRAITTSDPGAQRYFDQGMVLASAFNHAEAIRSFRAAQRLDPQCAMCFWGEALATGPNINVTSNGKTVMSREEQIAAYAALEKARAASGASDVERDLIAALGERYSPTPVEDRSSLERAYAEALGELATRYPDDDDVEIGRAHV